ncbi:MAG: ABC transporter permease [Bacteroidia bacterium]
MKKIWLVTKREYITRVKKKSFLVMTLLSPLLIVLFYGIIFYFSFNKDISDTSKKVLIVDESGNFENQLKNSKTISFEYTDIKKDDVAEVLESDENYGIIFIPANTDSIKELEFLGKEQPSLNTLDYIESQFLSTIKNKKLSEKGIDKEILTQINSQKLNLKTIKYTEKGIEKGNSGVTTMIGFIGAFLIYLFIFLYGIQVMRGVIEEKTNRIVEVIISSVKPFQLMMGKIVGIAMVGLTQFLLWIVLVSVLSGPVSGTVMNLMDVSPTEIAASQGANIPENTNEGGIGGFMNDLGNYNFTLILCMFLFYFISGYLFYGSLFAAIGSAVDNETDTQQFMFPMTMPLILAFVLAQSVVVNAPNGSIAVWLSMIPFTSPVVMMVRLPFGVPVWQILLSMLSMITGFIFTVWLAGRIYRIGILTFGKKPSYKEIWKWLFMNN